MNPNQLRSLIHRVLSKLADQAGIPTLYSDDAVELLMLTAAQESHCGRYLEQIKGPALGIFQMEPASYWDLVYRLSIHNPELHMAVTEWNLLAIEDDLEMRGNIPLQIVMARAYYYKRPGKLPAADNVPAMAGYYKQHWNTYLGKATVEEAKENYKKYAVK